jgi:hypothetical protein
MKLKITLIALLALAGALHAGAGDLICGPQLIESLPSDGQVRSVGWVNDTGKTVYVVKLEVYVYNATYNPGGNLFGAVSRNSDDNLLTYWSWVLTEDTEPHGPQGNEVVENFRPDYVTIKPGDGITLQAYSIGFGGPTNQALVSGYFWYTPTP